MACEPQNPERPGPQPGPSHPKGPAGGAGSREAVGTEGLRRRARKGETKGGGLATPPPWGREPPLSPPGVAGAEAGAAPNSLTCDIELAETGIRL